MDRFIDCHNHLHGFSFDDWELQGMCGMAGSVISCGNPHVHREIWKRAPGPEDVERLWESPLRMAEAAEAKHHIRAMCAVGVSSMTRVDGWERLIDALPGYLENDRVAALGEVGLDPGQYFGFSWDLDDQARCLEAQARLAAELEKPLILHTPTYKNPKEFLGGVDTQGEVSPEEFRLHYLKMDLEVIDTAGLDHSLLVIDHVDATIVDFVHEETGAWCATSLGSRLRPIPPSAVVEWVRRHGGGRMMLNSDLIPYTSNDLYCIPRAIRAMRRGGIAEAEIEKAAFGNANALFGFGL